MAGDEYDEGITQDSEAFYFEYRDVYGNHTIVGRDYDSNQVANLFEHDGPLTLFKQFLKSCGFPSTVDIYVNGEKVVD